MSDTRPVLVGSYPSRVDAELARAVLAANEIPALVSSDDAGGVAPWINLGVRLFVNEDDAEAALRLLADRRDA